ncbi:MAG: tetratricopeptide repeat protein [Chitinispirillaceae bacterium]|nr:tetratricopeptide repeat protein [Chitinispirillaceae bacterium]
MNSIMKRSGILIVFLIVLITVVFVVKQTCSQDTSIPVGSIQIDYPVEGTVFPPEFPAPVWIWRDTAEISSFWKIFISFCDNSSSSIQVYCTGERLQTGEIDPRCVASSHTPTVLSREQEIAYTWKPDSVMWEKIKVQSGYRPVKIIITGHKKKKPGRVISEGNVTITISRDSVGAPIFYRDVPLMPSENEKGVIKPLAQQAVPLIAWRIRDISKTKSRLVMDGIHSCANCHSFSADGRTLGMDMDGPRNDKGLYAIVKIQPSILIRNQDIVSWSNFRGQQGNTLRVGFMSQISPDARYVITTVNDPGVNQNDYERYKNPVDLHQSYYVANFSDYRFLQVFYPTRGVLVWYDCKEKKLHNLPGADDTSFVHANAVWSPDGSYLVFVRAKARDAYPVDNRLARYANDPNETQIQYDLHRIPFNNGRGGNSESVPGASQNGMSNSFPKISPDGRWIVFVQSRNGLLMRPDGQLFIVPSGGGTARRMRCNTSLMNSWHSFSPNSRWMVFSSKSRSPFTQMYLTHIDSTGMDSPPVLIENATASNRAVNIPEFLNTSSGGIEKILAPAADYARHTDLAVEAMKNRQYENAIQEWNKVLLLDHDNPRVYNSLGVALMENAKIDDAIIHYKKAISLNPQYAEAYNNMGEALNTKGNIRDAILQFKRAVKLNPDYCVAHANLGTLLAGSGHTNDAIVHLKKAAEVMPDNSEIRRNLGHALAEKQNFQDALIHLEIAVRTSNEKDPLALFLLGRVYTDLNRIPEALQVERKALMEAMSQNNLELVQAIRGHLDFLSGK